MGLSVVSHTLCRIDVLPAFALPIRRTRNWTFGTRRRGCSSWVSIETMVFGQGVLIARFARVRLAGTTVQTARGGNRGTGPRRRALGRRAVFQSDSSIPAALRLRCGVLLLCTRQYKNLSYPSHLSFFSADRQRVRTGATLLQQRHGPSCIQLQPRRPLRQDEAQPHRHRIYPLALALQRVFTLTLVCTCATLPCCCTALDPTAHVRPAWLPNAAVSHRLRTRLIVKSRQYIDPWWIRDSEVWRRSAYV
jgi:hypothetical protein